MEKPNSNVTVGELKTVLDLLPESMEVVIPVIDSDNNDKMLGFRLVRTVGTLSGIGKKDVLCINTSDEESDITEQVRELRSVDSSIRCTGLYL